MAQSQAQYTPAQILDLGRRAEADGRQDYALQLFRHLAEHYPGDPGTEPRRGEAPEHAVDRIEIFVDVFDRAQRVEQGAVCGQLRVGGDCPHHVLLFVRGG